MNQFVKPVLEKFAYFDWKSMHRHPIAMITGVSKGEAEQQIDIVLRMHGLLQAKTLRTPEWILPDEHCTEKGRPVEVYLSQGGHLDGRKFQAEPDVWFVAANMNIKGKDLTRLRNLLIPLFLPKQPKVTTRHATYTESPLGFQKPTAELLEPMYKSTHRNVLAVLTGKSQEEAIALVDVALGLGTMSDLVQYKTLAVVPKWSFTPYVPGEESKVGVFLKRATRINPETGKVEAVQNAWLVVVYLTIDGRELTRLRNELLPLFFNGEILKGCDSV